MWECADVLVCKCADEKINDKSERSAKGLTISVKFRIDLWNFFNKKPVIKNDRPISHVKVNLF